MTDPVLPHGESARAGAAGAAVERLLEVIRLLRRHCPWTAALDHAVLLEYLVEETYELYEAIDDVERAERAAEPAEHLREELRGELGDVLFQVVLHAQLQAEQGNFGLAEVARSLTAKLVRRNPHVFSSDGSLRRTFPASVDQIATTWQDVKKQERPRRTSPFDGIPHHLPAVAFAAKTLRRAGDPGRTSDPGRTGSAEQSEVGAQPDEPMHTDEVVYTEEAVGRELLGVIREALRSGVDPERALRRAVLEYQRDSVRQVAADDG
ncbi:nucleotide pyrophosphohydrolase [Arthrobacter echini]|uniref:Nucleotide pyrophosphohydrolase n=1 Tax=Arthrobacter echini TaxID=1529066 RepID=A0A4S5E8P7_9MICC|nr:MazG nucleotide pyrophosphohydrolase domain-containing protein [Arthrobacter echini]THJ67912.1 nucleotide pyrophosphohydrolase [Arthrobacter echini]